MLAGSCTLSILRNHSEKPWGSSFSITCARPTQFCYVQQRQSLGRAPYSVCPQTTAQCAANSISSTSSTSGSSDSSCSSTTYSSSGNSVVLHFNLNDLGAWEKELATLAGLLIKMMATGRDKLTAFNTGGDVYLYYVPKDDSADIEMSAATRNELFQQKTLSEMTTYIHSKLGVPATATTYMYWSDKASAPEPGEKRIKGRVTEKDFVKIVWLAQSWVVEEEQPSKLILKR